MYYFYLILIIIINHKYHKLWWNNNILPSAIADPHAAEFSQKLVFCYCFDHITDVRVQSTELTPTLIFSPSIYTNCISQTVHQINLIEAAKYIIFGLRSYYSQWQTQQLMLIVCTELICIQHTWIILKEFVYNVQGV